MSNNPVTIKNVAQIAITAGTNNKYCQGFIDPKILEIESGGNNISLTIIVLKKSL